MRSGVQEDKSGDATKWKEKERPKLTWKMHVAQGVLRRGYDCVDRQEWKFRLRESASAVKQLAQNICSYCPYSFSTNVKCLYEYFYIVKFIIGELQTV